MRSKWWTKAGNRTAVTHARGNVPICPLSLPGDAAVAAADKRDQVRSFRRRDLARDARQRLFQPQAGTVEIAVRLLEDADQRRLIPGTFEPHKVQSARLDGEPGAGEERRRIQVDPRIAAYHGQSVHPGVLMHQHSAGEERLILDLHIAA